MVTVDKLINFFNSFSEVNGLALWEILLNQRYGHKYISEYLIMVEDNEEAIKQLLQNIIDDDRIEFINMETGEILWELDNDTLVEKYRAKGFDPCSYFFAKETLIKPGIEFGELLGFFHTDNCSTYKKDGIMIHKPPIDGFWFQRNGAHTKRAEIVSAETGKVEHEFYGSCNDFEEWALALAAKGNKFVVKIMKCDAFPEGGIAVSFRSRLGEIRMYDDFTWGLE